ncbi:MAG: DUF4365 domain-containing protein [Desulfobacteraceae bacterium]|jgi:hypothetical protein
MKFLPGAGYSLIEQQGIAVLMKIASMKKSQGGLQCAFRLMNTIDYGIDAQIEFIIERNKKNFVTGRMLSLQIKSGQSYFKENGSDWVVDIKKTTVNYWKEHSLPVLLVIVDIEKQEAFWVRADMNTELDTIEGNKKIQIKIPKCNKFDNSSWESLWIMAASNNNYFNYSIKGRFEQALPWMIALHNGDKIDVHVEKLDEQAENRKRITIRYQFSADDLECPWYFGDQSNVKRTILTDEFFSDIPIMVKDLVVLLFDWAIVEHDCDNDEYRIEFNGLLDQAANYDPPRSTEESGLSDFDSWKRTTYFDKYEGLYKKIPSDGRNVYTFSLSRNNRGGKILKLLETG